ncbi:hypothetical protein EF68_000079 [Salmonella enterica subsp. enterica]|uniref:hypothetical protein n=1 Tax=Salmonella enterica TaxID=28901 RepID=UPI00098E07AE|nr:hypothetical protein [Salmonella enterica]EAB9374182.1 hypothetical protein [Salmonella enterica subsp. enterica serovar Llandoff]EAC0654300.1 hypothetical protein [Salmonella enterica subsp. enterica serovar Schwarzengrund]EBG0676432.1 hypothetical protein [Salmonella enterica subsp. enterica serovar Okatie]EBX9174169.1 hypothetical protein [Salmonella enterica subsp. enterica serovar Kandla]EBY1768560.1 hypothetical protein [Salmonella enterica subsp. enterica serovar Georgia]ECV3918119.
MFEKENVMPGCISACSCVARPTPPDPKTPPAPKWIELKGYCVTCNSQEDIRPLKEGEPKKRMTAMELVMARRLLKDTGVTQHPWQDPIVKPNNCGLPFFPVDAGERETDV